MNNLPAGGLSHKGTGPPRTHPPLVSKPSAIPRLATPPQSDSTSGEAVFREAKEVRYRWGRPEGFEVGASGGDPGQGSCKQAPQMGR